MSELQQQTSPLMRNIGLPTTIIWFASTEMKVSA
jgi:hypothetical protein